MSYRIARVDSNQKEIVAAARKMGCSVAITSMLGNGFPDIVVGYKGFNYLIEIKDGSKPLSSQKLTKDEQKFHSNWGGKIDIIKDIDELVSLVRG